jgi:PHP family Zn ribbon phosphoesterase
MNYDLHIHSGLSPCAEDDMSPNNIVRMAKLNKLDVIAVCDHNSLKQQAIIAHVAKMENLTTVYGLELQSIEEVHILAYFKDESDCRLMQSWINSVQISRLNKPEYFGNQFLYDAQDEIIDSEEIALINSLNAKLDTCIELIHQCHGKAVLAHIYDRSNGIIEQLGFIPNNLLVDGIELNKAEDIKRFNLDYPHYQDLPCFINSDAHRLSDIKACAYPISPLTYESFWS